MIATHEPSSVRMRVLLLAEIEFARLQEHLEDVIRRVHGDTFRYIETTSGLTSSLTPLRLSECPMKR